MASVAGQTAQAQTRELLDTILSSCPAESIPSPHPAARKAVCLARYLQERAAALQTPEEKEQQAEFDRMMQNPRDKATLVQMTDQAFRSSRPGRAASQLIHILDVQGIPRFFSGVERALLKGFQSFGRYLPGVAVSLVKEQMREETANVILPAEEELLTKHLAGRRDAGLRMNLNFLGEAILGEEEAQSRLETYLAALQMPEVEVVSVKISTIYSQISSLARAHSSGIISDRLELLFRAAAKMRFERGDGAVVPKFVYLDMEEYRDMDITAEAFMRALDRPKLKGTGAGLALQAYLPDSHECQRRINAWARERVASGGAPVTIRLVKGANMETERVEASIRGWPQAPFKTKAEVDANFKRMLHEGLRSENIRAVHLGIASHNLFELAYGLVLAIESEALDKVQFEMLEGMANPQRRALFELSQGMLLYAPAVRKELFVNAIGYLVRRLDENAGPENFLRYAFRLETGSPEWEQLERAFLASFEVLEGLPSAPRRTQNRSAPLEEARPPADAFVNDPDTDFTLPENVDWAVKMLERWKARFGENAEEVPLVVDGEEILEGRAVQDCFDPSRPGTLVGRCRQGTGADVERAIQCAREDPDGWRTATPAHRHEILGAAAAELRRARGEMMGAAMAECGKIFPESDPEVSEAVDFVEYYRRSALEFQRLENLRAKGKGAVVVASPWNFPISIPCGGVAAALAAGNTVILKPAPEGTLVAYRLCACFWRAGISRRALQFLPCPERDVGSRLVSHPLADAVILTGGTETALQFLKMKADVNLLAETGGKNATIVTALSDRAQAIKHILHSAFSHSGQKCSATSLLILEEEVYEDPQFRKALCDAVRSLPVGSAWDLHTKVGPLIRPPEGALDRALKELEKGESWAVMPRRIGDNPHLYSPGVKWGVRPGSFTHMTELFGPLLGVMKAKDLEEAILLVNQTGFGLTSGLESLDSREQEKWQGAIRAGNLYINRVTTGAIVLRQPFGGMGKSAFGPGIKAGGPNYAAQLMDFDEVKTPRREEAAAEPELEEFRNRLLSGGGPEAGLSPEETHRLASAIGSYALNAREEFLRTHDHFKLVGEDNIRRYLPVKKMRIRLHPKDSAFDLIARVCAAKTVGCGVTVSFPPGGAPPALGALRELTKGWQEGIAFLEESDAGLAASMRRGEIERLRYAGPDRVPPEVFAAVQDTGLYVARAPVLAEGRIELLWYVREQSISDAYHRYGNLGARAEEERAAIL